MNIEKIENKKYLKELQKFYDLVDNIDDVNLKKSIIYQFLKLEKIINNSN